MKIDFTSINTVGIYESGNSKKHLSPVSNISSDRKHHAKKDFKGGKRPRIMRYPNPKSNAYTITYIKSKMWSDFVITLRNEFSRASHQFWCNIYIYFKLLGSPMKLTPEENTIAIDLLTKANFLNTIFPRLKPPQFLVYKSPSHPSTKLKSKHLPWLTLLEDLQIVI